MKFNDDLLLQKDDRKIARQAYPKFYFALDFPELRAFFEPYDVLATETKTRSRRAGFGAIACGIVAWFLAVAEPTYANFGFTKDIILICAALLGILSVVVGVRGLLFSSAKQKWLLNRFITERTRQFFFQNIFFHLVEIGNAVENNKAQKEFRARSLTRFEPFKQNLITKTAAEFDRVVKGSDDNSYWAVPPTHDDIHKIDITKCGEIFAAYRDLRINHQLNYAWYKLRQPQSLFDFPAAFQERLFSTISLSAIVILFLLNFSQIAAVIAGTKLIGDPWSYIISIWIALVPLAIRTLEEGLQPQREVERYENYKNFCRLKSEQFDAAETIDEKVTLIMEMERTSIEEMRLFLKTHLAARFVM